MRAIARAMRAMRAAAASVVKKLVWVGDKLVSIFVPAPMPAMDALEPDDVAANDNLAPPSQPLSEHQAIRELAYCQLIGRMPTAQQLGAVTQLQADWIACLDREMARKVINASDADLRAHLLGNRCLRGVLWCDEACIDDYTTALDVREATREQVAMAANESYRPRR